MRQRLRVVFVMQGCSLCEDDGGVNCSGEDGGDGMKKWMDATDDCEDSCDIVCACG